jgi:hypothetical protein
MYLSCCVGFWRQVYRTLVHGAHECDAFIPAELPPTFERDAGMHLLAVSNCVLLCTVCWFSWGLRVCTWALRRERANELHQRRELDQV